jgi:uncharacterized membrane protein YkoI
MKAPTLLVAATLAATCLAAGTAAADDKPKIERTAAEKIALARVPGGTVKEGELETEHGKLVWSFDIAQKTSPNIVEVQVDAMTGKVVAQETETPEEEKSEEKKEHK